MFEESVGSNIVESTELISPRERARDPTLPTTSMSPPYQTKQYPHRCPPPFLHPQVCRDLLSIHGMNIVVIADDSSSMTAVCSSTNVYNPTTRWDELKQMLERLVTMMLVVDGHGFDLKFLNDENWYKINSEKDLAR